MLDPQEKTTLETQPSINQQKMKTNSKAKAERKLQIEAETKFDCYVNSAREQ